VSLLDPASFEAEQYRQLRQGVEELGRTRSLRVLAVTSAVAGDGKTLTAINLAASLAQRDGASILIVDADLRHPTVAARLGIECTSGGFEAAVQGKAGSLQDFVHPISSSLSVLPCSTSWERTYEILTSPRLKELFNEARQRYDYVVVDTPPIIPVQDSSLICSSVDGYALVVSANSTPRQLVGESLNRLDAGVFVGLVFNRDDRPLFGYYKMYYREYIRLYGRSMRPRP
jgi:capsular exopolysaccharide synthesis family protein